MTRGGRFFQALGFLCLWVTLTLAVSVAAQTERRPARHEAAIFKEKGVDAYDMKIQGRKQVMV